MSLSVVVITRNEAANLRACLESVPFADEIVVLDSGSTDETVAIARECGARVTQTADWPGFGPQKNRALALASCDWVLSLDADERVTPALAAQIREAMASGVAAAYEIPRLTRFCGQWIHHCGWTPDRVLRLFRRGQARFSDDLVHERVLMELGTLRGRLTTALLHESYPTPAPTARPGPASTTRAAAAPRWRGPGPPAWWPSCGATSCGWASSMARWVSPCVRCRPKPLSANTSRFIA